MHIAPLDAGEPSNQRKDADEIIKRMEAIVDGEVLSLEDLGRLPDGGTDEKALRKVSKLDIDPWWHDGAL